MITHSFTFLHCSSPYKFLIPLNKSFLTQDLFSQELHYFWYRWQHQEHRLGTIRSWVFFGTPALLWRVLHFVGYTELPRYFWTQEYVEGQPWYEVQVSIPARAQQL
jgi:hypothetical protein